MRYDEPLSRHTTWKVGGPARCYVEPRNMTELAQFIADHSNEPFFWLGLGSNVLIRDGGFAGSVIALKHYLNQYRLLDSQRIWAQAGISCAKLARIAARAGLCGLSFLSGIPGTLGGALSMNAGAFGSEIWPWVESVQTVNRQGQLQQREASEYRFSYRQLILPCEEWFVSAVLRLQRGDIRSEQARIRDLLQKRRLSQPIGTANAGSTFRNPPGDHAGRLIESCGLKGFRIGQAMVSEKHANFIINLGGAKAKEIEELITYVQNKVYLNTGVQLKTEVHILGESI